VTALTPRSQLIDGGRVHLLASARDMGQRMVARHYAADYVALEFLTERLALFFFGTS